MKIKIKNGNIIYLEDNVISEVEKDFLYFNKTLLELMLNNALIVKDFFLFHNRVLKNIELSRVINIGNYFSPRNNAVKKIDFPCVEYIKDSFFISQ